MQQSDPQKFWVLGDEGQRAYWAHEHVSSYYEGCLVQYERVFAMWRASSQIPEEAEDSWETKVTAMNQVIRDIHFLLVSKQAICRALQTLCSPDLYPRFQNLVPLNAKWGSYFEQFRNPRNSFEHFEDQVLGKDSRKNSPGFGVRLTPNGEFSLGTHTPVLIGEASRLQLVEFHGEFENTILGCL
jgi:hypothetical protein